MPRQTEDRINALVSEDRTSASRVPAISSSSRSSGGGRGTSQARSSGSGGAQSSRKRTTIYDDDDGDGLGAFGSSDLWERQGSSGI